jgi:hypothetical protein
VVDGKQKSGQANHLEATLLKALEDVSTLAELGAAGLYCVIVSGPYLLQARGGEKKSGKEMKPVNLLDLGDVHRRLPSFCQHIADNPAIIFDKSTPLSELTLDGRPIADRWFLESLRQLAPELPALNQCISAMFSGAAKGWVQFTKEFAVGGTFDQLSPQQRATLFIPATNDANEGALGSLRIHIRSNPSSNAYTFSDKARYERNNTEAFIEKCCSDADHKYARILVRQDEKNKKKSMFNKKLVQYLFEKAARARQKKQESEARNERFMARLRSIGWVSDGSSIEKMTGAHIKDQIRLYKNGFVRDEILEKRLWKTMVSVEEQRTALKEALGRVLARYVLSTDI